MHERVFPGCVIGIVQALGQKTILSFGHLTYEASERVREDTIYDLASVTKSIPVALLALETLDLAKPVVDYLPELECDFGATVADLLAYRVRGQRMSEMRGSADDITACIMRRGFAGPTGRAEYTNLPAFLLGMILERVGGDTLENLARQHIFEMLGMEHTFFLNKKGFPLSSFAPTEIDESGDEVRGIVHDESARIFAREGRAVGHAGLFSTASDVLTVLGAFLRGDFPHAAAGAERGLGWQIEGDFLGANARDGVFGKTGFTGTSIVCDMRHRIAFVILSNRTYPHRPADSRAINAFRADVANVVLACMDCVTGSP